MGFTRSTNFFLTRSSGRQLSFHPEIFPEKNTDNFAKIYRLIKKIVGDTLVNLLIFLDWQRRR
ncbi:MAG: hypothetical protein F6K18_08800 [Okeania sp. SIO2C2]|uniref:hypothetical protein n=1 Tax=Okeania sp. SIO2C2 TaxID=2607787 RepID=UPI0013B5DE98|nr:hypothetical protein [Okeania sp. SIO2C2]NEP86923.1 hypothetical protein [Okeania sp. SIO2C2]